MTVAQPQRVAFVGLGVMGFPMAGHLAAAGHDVHVYNRDQEKAARWVAQHRGHAHPTPERAARGATTVFVCVGADDSVRAVIAAADGVFSALAPGAVVVDHTTASATVAREMAVLGAQRGIGFVDAPVSGGEAGAVNGKLTVMAGGTPEHFAHADALWGCYASSATHIGPSGTGQLTKMVNQVCISGVLQGLAEGILFLEASGLPADKVFAAIGGGAAQSWQMDNRADTMVAREFDFGFAVDWMRKDLGLALEEARARGLVLPGVSRVDEQYAQVQSQGGARFDTSSLILALDKRKD